MARAAWLEFGENFADVLALCGKASGTFGVFGIVTKQMTVFLHIGAASGRIRHNCLDVCSLENIDGLFGKLDGRGFFSRMHKNRATAGLGLRSDHIASFGGENARGGGINLREE